MSDFFGDIFSGIGDLFSDVSQAAPQAAEDIAPAAESVAQAAPDATGDILSQFGDGAAFAGGGDIPWDQLIGNANPSAAQGGGDLSQSLAAIQGGQPSTVPTPPMLNSAAPGTGGPTASALVGPGGPDPTDVAYAPGMGPNGPTTPGNPVDQAVQYINSSPQTGGGATPPPGNEGGGFFDKALSQVQKNPLAALGVGAAGIGTVLQTLNGQSGAEKQLQAIADQQAALGNNLAGQGAAGVSAAAANNGAQAQTLLNPLVNGAPLPAGAQAQILQNQRSAEASARSRAASSGTLNSTMTDSQIAQAREQALTDDWNARNNLAKTGLSLDQLSAQQYNALLSGGVAALGGADSGYSRLLQTQIQEDADFQNSLAALASSLGKFGNGTTNNNGTDQTQNRYYR